MKTGRLGLIGRTGIGHAVPCIVVLIAPAPDRLADGKMIPDPGFKLDESSRHVAILAGIELGAEGNEQMTVAVAAGSQ